MTEQARVGVGVYILKESTFLMGKRLGDADGSSRWCIPGGHVEFMETLEDAGRREVMEETGLIVKNLRRGPVTQELFPEEGKHYVSVSLIAEYVGGEPEVREPDKCAGWQWVTLDNLPDLICAANKQLLEEGFSPFTL